MSGGAKKAAPREKDQQFQDGYFRVERVSFIGAQLRQVGELVQLPVGVEAGSNLTPVDEDGNVRKTAAKAKAQAYDLTFLDGTVPDITGALEGKPAAELAAYLKAEKAGKARVGVLGALETAHAAAVEAEKNADEF